MNSESYHDSESYVSVRRIFLRLMGLAMLTYFAFDFTNALTNFTDTIPEVTYLRLLAIPLTFYLVTGFYCLKLSRQKSLPTSKK